jgi:signal transduction histidine kinase
MKVPGLTAIVAAMTVVAAPGPVFAQERASLLSGYTMTSWTLADGAPIGPVYAIAQDADGYLWLGTADGAVRFDGARFTPWNAVYPGPFPRGDVQSLTWSPAGTLWIGFGALGGATTVGALREGVLTRISAGAAPKAATTAVLEDRAGRVWAVSAATLHRLRDGRWDAMREGALGHAEAISVREDLTGAIWVGTRQGVFRTTDGESFQPVDDGIARETSEGADGSLWMTDPSHGARRQGARTPLTGIDGRGMRLLHDSRGNLWVATTGQGLWRVRDGADTRSPLIERATTQTGLSSNSVQPLLEDREGNIWVGTMLGLHSLTPQQLSPVASGAMVQAILPHPDGSVRVETTNGPMQFRLEHGTWRGTAAASAGLPTANAPRPARVGEQAVDAIFDAAHGTTWAGGTAGLARIRDEHVEWLGPGDGLPAQRVMAITQSDDGFLWLGVDRGPQHAGRRAAVIRLHPSDFDRAVAQKQPVTNYQIYDATNGLAGVPLGPVSAGRSRDGSLWFAFGGSLTVVNPRQVSKESSRAAAFARIAGVTIDDRAASLAGEGVLPAGTRKLQIDYTALRLTAPRQSRFRYRLDGFDPDWVDAGARRQAYYTNLAPGSYVFRVQASGDGGAWTVPEARWPFAVRPAFHQTGWFYALVATGLLLIAWAVAHTRVWLLNRQFQATLAERARLSREIHDTMLQSLAGIALQVQAIARQCTPEAAEQQSRLVALRRQVEEYMREARQAVQDLRSPMLEACGLAGALEEIGRRTVTPPARLEISVDVPATVSAAVESELLRIAQEAITNAAHHADARTIRVDLHQDGAAIRLRVTDDGRGFDVDAMLTPGTAHYGLTGMQERAARIGGLLTVTSSAAGTIAEATVPCGRQRG